MSVRASAAIYFGIQGFAVLAWWWLLIGVPGSRRYFQMSADSPDSVLLAFWLPDLLLMATGSLAASALLFFDSRLTQIALWFVAGATSYAALYCLAFALLTDQGWLGATLMLPAMLWSGVFAVGLSTPKDYMFRLAKPARTSWIVGKTVAQIFVVWTLILFVFPYFIVQLEDKLGVPRFAFPLQKAAAAIFFVAVSSIGLSSAWLMSKIGRGTPLPLDAATKLVVAGAYAFVRNPMAISGVGQGLAVGLWLGSPLVLIYAAMGALIWQLIFRKLEEIDLANRFGAEYENYRRAVRCWIPRFKPYRTE